MIRLLHCGLVFFGHPNGEPRDFADLLFLFENFNLHIVWAVNKYHAWSTVVKWPCPDVGPHFFDACKRGVKVIAGEGKVVVALRAAKIHVCKFTVGDGYCDGAYVGANPGDAFFYLWLI